MEAQHREAVGKVGLWESEGLADLYRRHAPEAVRVAYLITGESQLAEDLTQDAFIRSVGRLAHLRERDAFGAYLRKTVVNLCKMHFRRRAVERKHDHALQPERSMEASTADADEVRQALARLTHRQRVAIVLRYYVDLPNAEIAAELGCSEGTVRSLISRGTAHLRELMGVDEDG